MIQDKALASKLNALLLEAAGLLNEAASVIAQSDCSEEEKGKVLRVIGAAMGTIGSDALNPLYRAHKELKPCDYLLPEEYTGSE